MAGKIITDISRTVTAVAANGVLTLSDTAGIYERAYAYLSIAGQPGVTVQVTQILVAGANGTIKVREVKDPRGNIIGMSPIGLTGGDYRYYAAALYSGGLISIPSQVIMNSNDLGLT